MSVYLYDAFGNGLESREVLFNRIRYTGQQYDRETGQYYLRARYYNSHIGRFTQEDTYRGDGLNLYAYCGNNPVVYYDPSGHATKKPACGGENPNSQDDSEAKRVATVEGGTTSINDLPENQSYDSFSKLKKDLGSPGTENDWHHIVEQSQIKKSGFTSQQINNTSNIISVDHATHMKISGYYNTKGFDFTNGLSVRDWLAGQSYEYQYSFGLDVLRQFGVLK